MSQFSGADLDAFLDTDDLGTSATYKEGGIGGGTSINTVYSNDYVEISGGTVEIEGTYPTALCKTSDVSNASHADTLTIDGVVYDVIGVQPKSTTGTTKLVLNEQ